MFDWQTLGTIVAVAGVTIALIALAHEIRVSRDERAFDTFIRFLDAYENQQVRRRAKWKVISGEIAFYQNKLADIHKLRESQKGLRLFSVMRSEWLTQFNLQGYHDQPPR